VKNVPTFSIKQKHLKFKTKHTEICTLISSGLIYLARSNLQLYHIHNQILSLLQLWPKVALSVPMTLDSIHTTRPATNTGSATMALPSWRLAATVWPSMPQTPNTSPRTATICTTWIAAIAQSWVSCQLNKGKQMLKIALKNALNGEKKNTCTIKIQLSSELTKLSIRKQ